MLLSVTTENDSCSLEVAEDLELENFKALCESEINIPSTSMTVLVNGTPLIDDKKSLTQLGVKDGDLVMIVRDTQSQQPRNLPSAIQSMDFSSIQVPGTSQQRAPAPAQRRSDDPAAILELLKNNPAEMGRLRHNNSPLAAAAEKGLEEFTKVLKEQQNAKAEKERQRIRMLTADPFDAEAQKMIADEIKKGNIDANMEAAMGYNPESFGTVQMLYINCKVNGFPVKAFIDSGAQATIMSEKCARRCNIMRLVDERWAGIAKGVGTQKILGRVHMTQLEIEGVFLASSFCILQEQSMEMLLGLDMLKRHQMVIDLQQNVLKIGTTNTSARFLSDSELPEDTKLTPTSELARQQSEQQAQMSEDQQLAEALAASQSSASNTLPPNTTEEDIAEIVSAGFTREEAISEMQSTNGNKTAALGALFAKRFAFR